MQREVWRLFEVEGNGDSSLAARDKYTHDDKTWAAAFQRHLALGNLDRARVLELFRDVDVILAPATPCVAPKLGQQTLEVDGEVLPLRPMLGVYTQPISCIGLPVLAVPVPLPGGLPIGVQLIAAPGREDVLFRVADVLERSGAVRAPRPGEG